MRRAVILILLICINILMAQINEQKLTFPLVYKWSKQSTDGEGCIDPSEPFQCPGSNTCISLQFLCDDHPNDCPNNYDEDPSVCVAMKRPAKDSIRRFLSAEYTNHGSKYIEYLFGSKAAGLFTRVPNLKAIDLISISLAVSPNVELFSKLLNMNELEKQRLIHALESVNTGQVQDLPPFINDSISEGLSSLVNKLISSDFLKTVERK